MNSVLAWIASYSRSRIENWKKFQESAPQPTDPLVWLEDRPAFRWDLGCWWYFLIGGGGYIINSVSNVFFKVGCSAVSWFSWGAWLEYTGYNQILSWAKFFLFFCILFVFIWSSGCRAVWGCHSRGTRTCSRATVDCTIWVRTLEMLFCYPCYLLFVITSLSLQWSACYRGSEERSLAGTAELEKNLIFKLSLCNSAVFSFN